MISPELHCWSQVLGMPSIISVLTSKPREVNWRAVRFVLMHRDAGDAVEQVGDVGEALILDALLRDHRDRLWRLARRHAERRRGLRLAGGVGAGAFGRFTEALGGDGDGRQDDFLARFPGLARRRGWRSPAAAGSSSV
jgi:hypothetical protein